MIFIYFHVKTIFFWHFNKIIYKSSDYCLGSAELIDRFEAFQVKILNHKKVLDVGCGDRFTVVIATDRNSTLPSLALQSFNQKNFIQIKSKVNLLKEFAKKKEEINNRPEISRMNESEIKNTYFRKKKREITIAQMLKQKDIFNFDDEMNHFTDSIDSKTNLSMKRNPSNPSKSPMKEFVKNKSEQFLEVSQRIITEINSVRNPSHKKSLTEESEKVSQKLNEIEVSDERGKK